MHLNKNYTTTSADKSQALHGALLGFLDHFPGIGKTQFRDFVARDHCRQSADPCIQIKLQLSEDDFVVSVRNRIGPDAVITDNVIPLSTKDGLGHGMGLKNVITICDKYHAEYVLSAKQGWFQFTMLAYLQAEK